MPFLRRRHRGHFSLQIWSSAIDSEESIPPAYVGWRTITTNRVVVQARQAGNRFLGSLEGIQIGP
jgi:hypothetical protein